MVSSRLKGATCVYGQAATVRGNTEFTDDVVFPALQELLGLPEAADFPLSRFRHLTAVARPRTTAHAAPIIALCAI